MEQANKFILIVITMVIIIIEPCGSRSCLAPWPSGAAAAAPAAAAGRGS